jgi:hypothetical protein
MQGGINHAMSLITMTQDVLEWKYGRLSNNTGVLMDFIRGHRSGNHHDSSDVGHSPQYIQR